MCLACGSTSTSHGLEPRVKGTPRRILTKEEFSPEVERAFQTFLSDYVDELEPVENDIAEFVDEASDADLESLEAIRAELDTRLGNYTNDFDVVFREGGENAAQAGRELAARRHSLDVGFDVVPESTLEQIDDWAEVAANSTLDTITEDSTRWLRSAHEEGLGIDEISSQLNNEFFDDHLEDHVARRAARTGTISTSNAGSHSTFVDADSVIGEQWLATDDDRTRDSHADADQQIVHFDTEFEVGGETADHPGDPTLSVGEIANCRCTIVPIFADDLTEDQLDRVLDGDRIYVNL